jgi:hypothetical protein
VTAAAAPGPEALHGLAAAVHTASIPVDRVLASIAREVGSAVAPGIDLSGGGPLLDGTIEPLGELPAALPPHALGPDLLGSVLEVLHEPEARRRNGAFYTPSASAARAFALATSGWAWPARPRVCDPACGGGAFLLAAARLLVARGFARREIVDELLWGVDLDPLAVATTRAALSLWCASGGQLASAPHVVAGDTLASGLAAWSGDTKPFDLVVGNPPFRSQLSSRTARSRDRARAMQKRFGAVSRAYVDSSTLFLVAAAEMTASGGRCALILPESFLAARDAAPARAEVLERGALVGLWLPRTPLFSASVRVCVPVVEIGGSTDVVQRWRGPSAELASVAHVPDGEMDAGKWADLAADLLGVPDVDVREGQPLGVVATATAGFRDQFYGLRPFVRERAAGDDAARVRLVTSGSIDLVNDLSARRRITFAGTSWTDPVVDVERMRHDDPALARWAERVLVPKVVLATQTRVVEVLVDETGSIWPSVPVVAVVAEPEELWRVAAALASPPVCALALRRHAGAALAGDAIKLSARQVLELPLPTHGDRWAEGADHLRAASSASRAGDGNTWRHAVQEFGTAMCGAYDASPDVLEWWLARLPAFR